MTDAGKCLNRLAVSGEMDQYPEVAFYMVGDIEEVKTKAEKLAAEM